MSDVQDLIARCRKGRNSEPILMLGGRAHDPRCMEAADVLATQSAEIERLLKMLRENAQEYLAIDMQATEALARATAAEAEVERLKALLAIVEGEA